MIPPKFIPPGDPHLNERSEEVSAEEIKSKEIQSVIDRMFEVANGEREEDAKRGLVGLAAPQIGVMKRIILVDMDVSRERLEWGELVAYINPIITWSSEETERDREGCFSVDAHVCGIVPRSSAIEITALDRYGEPIEKRLTGFTARVFQHEVDHLEGIRFPDRVGEDGLLHWIENEQVRDYRKNWREWPIAFPWKGWIAMKEGKYYDAPSE